MKNSILLCELLVIVISLSSCKKEAIKPTELSLTTLSNSIQAIETFGDTIEVYRLNSEIVNPNGVVDNYDLRLLPFPEYRTRMEELINQSNNSQIISEFTGIVRAYKDSVENFSAYYEDGAFINSIIFTPEGQPRVGPECPHTYYVYYTYIEITDWWQIGGGTVSYLGSTSEIITEIVEMCTPPGFDQYYTDYTVNTQYLNATQARAWLFDKIYDRFLGEGIELLNPCKPENSSADNIREVLDELEIFSEEAFIEEFIRQLSNCEGGLSALALLDEEIIAVLEFLETTPFGSYARCADVVFSSSLPSINNRRISHLNLRMDINTFLCIPPVPESEGILQNLDYSIKLEAQIPNYLFGGPFGYTNQQTNIATHYSEAIEYAWNLIDSDLTCATAVSKRGDFHAFIMDYLNDPDTKQAIWGSSYNDIVFKKGYQTVTPGYNPVTSNLSLYQTDTNCN